VGENGLTPPWPDFVIGSGELGTVAAALVKKRSPQRTFAVSFHTPKRPLEEFDAVISTPDGPATGPHILSTTGAFSALTPQRLREAAQIWRDTIKHLPQPWIGVWVGGPSAQSRLCPQALDQLIRDLCQLARSTGGGLMVNAFHPLPPQDIKRLSEGLAGVPHVLWTGEGENPHEGFLAAADYLLAPLNPGTLLGDFLATDKPLYLYPALTSPTRSSDILLKHLESKGLARPFKGSLDFWSRTFVSDIPFVAGALMTRLMSID
jgi:mitochondrial fission protein ELM1